MFYHLCLLEYPDDLKWLTFQPCEDILKKKRTVSDSIIDAFRKKGYGIKGELPNDVAAEVSLKNCEKMLKEIDETEDSLYKAYNAGI